MFTQTWPKDNSPGDDTPCKPHVANHVHVPWVSTPSVSTCSDEGPSTKQQSYPYSIKLDSDTPDPPWHTSQQHTENTVPIFTLQRNGNVLQAVQDFGPAPQVPRQREADYHARLCADRVITRVLHKGACGNTDLQWQQSLGAGYEFMDMGSWEELGQTGTGAFQSTTVLIDGMHTKHVLSSLREPVHHQYPVSTQGVGLPAPQEREVRISDDSGRDLDFTGQALQYFTVSSSRRAQRSRACANIRDMAALLNEQEQDIGLLVQLCKDLLSRNQVLCKSQQHLEQELDVKLHQGAGIPEDFLQAFTDLHQQIDNVVADSAELQSKKAHLQGETNRLEEKEEELVGLCVQELQNDCIGVSTPRGPHPKILPATCLSDHQDDCLVDMLDEDSFSCRSSDSSNESLFAIGPRTPSYTWDKDNIWESGDTAGSDSSPTGLADGSTGQ